MVYTRTLKVNDTGTLVYQLSWRIYLVSVLADC